MGSWKDRFIYLFFSFNFKYAVYIYICTYTSHAKAISRWNDFFLNGKGQASASGRAKPFGSRNGEAYDEKSGRLSSSSSRSTLSLAANTYRVTPDTFFARSMPNGKRVRMCTRSRARACFCLLHLLQWFPNLYFVQPIFSIPSESFVRRLEMYENVRLKGSAKEIGSGIAIQRRISILVSRVPTRSSIVFSGNLVVPTRCSRRKKKEKIGISFKMIYFARGDYDERKNQLRMQITVGDKYRNSSDVSVVYRGK